MEFLLVSNDQSSNGFSITFSVFQRLTFKSVFMTRHQVGFLILPFFIFLNVGAQTAMLSIEQAKKQGLIKVDISGKGGYTGDVILFAVKNISQKDLQLNIEAGRRLDSKDSTEQDILVNRNEIFALKKGESKNINVSGMCCQAHNHSPQEKSVFSIGKMASPLLVKIAEYIDLHKLHSRGVAQDAVWVLSDNNPVESIYDSADTLTSNNLTRFVCSLTNQPFPNFRIMYEKSVEPFSNKPTKVTGDITYYVQNNGLVTIAIYDKFGKSVKIFSLDQPTEPGEYHIGYEFNVATLPHDIYYLRVLIDGQKKKEVPIKF